MIESQLSLLSHALDGLMPVWSYEGLVNCQAIEGDEYSTLSIWSHYGATYALVSYFLKWYCLVFPSDIFLQTITTCQTGCALPQQYQSMLLAFPVRTRAPFATVNFYTGARPAGCCCRLVHRFAVISCHSACAFGLHIAFSASNSA